MDALNLTVGAEVEGFVVEQIVAVGELRSQAIVARHQVTGARLLHLYNDDPNNLFCIAFRTPVFDNTGVPHILEHSVLGGSRKYPVKDPFQILLKGSLQTFLNAMTYPDRTIYPVSSQVEADFYNLVDVYCDAVFHPLLTRNTLNQEGWHFDIPQKDSPVAIKGIVYNEMKGVFSDFSSHVARKTFSALFPDTTYYYESGGEPEQITDLTYERFVDFHHQFYHPANSWIFLYGNLPTQKTLERIQQGYLASFAPLTIDSTVAPQPLWSAPRTVVCDAPAPAEEEGTATVVVSWIAGDSTNPEDALVGAILSRYLLSTQSSPLRRALIDSGLGEDLDDMCGFDSDLRQGFFAAGLRKTRPEHADTIKDLVLATLRTEVEQGLDSELIEGALRRTEFGLREVSDAGRYPYNLRLADRCFRSWLYDGDPLAHLAFEQPLERIKRAHASDSRWFAGKIKQMFVDNPHCLVSVIRASAALSATLEKQSEEQAARLSAGFTDNDRAHHHAITSALLEQQKAQPTPEQLATVPSLNKKDLPPKNQITPCEEHDLAGGGRLFSHGLYTGGIVYVDIGFDCAGLSGEQVMYLLLYSELAIRCGAAGMDYEKMSKRIALVTGGLSSSIMADEGVGQSAPQVFRYFVHGKCLGERFDEMSGVVSDLLLKPEFDNKKLIRDILLEMRNDLSSSVVSSGHSFASSLAAAPLSRTRQIVEDLDGITQLRFLDKLVKEKSVDRLVQVMQDIHRSLITSQGCVVSLTADVPGDWHAGVQKLIASLPQTNTGAAAGVQGVSDSQALGVAISSSVNFVAKAWKIGPQDSAGLGLFSLMGQHLSRGYLWDKVRVEGGAYGAFASLGSTYPVFSCASYRDPNLEQTLEQFEQGLRTVASSVTAEEVDQSIIGTIGQLDKPRSPHSRGYGETCSRLLGKTDATRQATREAILGATPSTLRAKAQEVLDSKENVVVVLGNKGTLEKACKQGTIETVEPLLG